MIQIAIWALAIMLVVKGLDILHQQRVAEQDGKLGAPALANTAAVIAILGAVLVVYTASRQSSAMSGLTSYKPTDAALEAYERYKARVGAGAPDDMGNLDSAN
ncbi:hypothetical protein [Sphingomonas sp.]|uniref:hypothetical protein n=1 Tax=Sphingomonas sp. TaxID=28214 RepID=UPI0025EA96A1|nr:hypothetical protein [Sphingomonas sp.]